jgi:hypothetical protein
MISLFRSLSVAFLGMLILLFNDAVTYPVYEFVTTITTNTQLCNAMDNIGELSVGCDGCDEFVSPTMRK